ncbi:MAG: TraR/DksA family transcriptional regulator [Candidatus Algichlamydia australiensis]|nr:TraR/DksA family transcriptional regulator [Chlamydiales bacterium]
MPLKKSEIEKYKKQLIELRAQLMGNLDEVSKEVRAPEEGKGFSQHQADEGTDDFVRNVSLNVGSKEREILDQIERALEKIEEGTYGKCDSSGQPIPVKRLDAIPYATRTADEQEKFEKGLL